MLVIIGSRPPRVETHMHWIYHVAMAQSLFQNIGCCCLRQAPLALIWDSLGQFYHPLPDYPLRHLVTDAGSNANLLSQIELVG